MPGNSRLASPCRCGCLASAAAALRWRRRSGRRRKPRLAACIAFGHRRVRARWNWQRAGVEVESHAASSTTPRRIADDVAAPRKSGELARADQHQADGAVAAAEAGLQHRPSSADHGHAATGQGIVGADADDLPAVSNAAAEPEPAATRGRMHPALAELQDRAAVAERAAALARRSRAPTPK